MASTANPLPLYEDPAAIQASFETQNPIPSITTTSIYSPALLGSLSHRLQFLNLGPPVWNLFVEPGTEHHIQRFIGTLTISENQLEQKIVVSVVEPDEDSFGKGLPSKKDVKAVLAQKALLLLENVQPQPKSKITSNSTQKPTIQDDDTDGINWTGRVLEYNNSLPMAHRTLTYTESSTSTTTGPGPHLFSCTLNISGPFPPSPPGSLATEYSVLTFPSQDSAPQLFSSKKAAKLHSSRLAGQHLISVGLLQADGSLPPKSNPLPAPAITQTASTGASISSTIPSLCEELGLSAPQYTYHSPSGDPSNINPFVNCSAHFPSIHGLPDPAVTVSNVYGKKKAKEECAQALLGFLEKVKEWRLKGGGPWTG